MHPSILLVTEPGAGVGIKRVLDDAGYQVQPSHTIAAACAALESGGVDLALVNLDSSEVDSMGALRALRARTSAALVLIDSGRQAELDHLLAAGADDFLSKPFSAAQLRARIYVALSDRQRRRENALIVGELRVDPVQRRAWLNGSVLELSRREFDMLACLAVRAGEVVTRSDLARSVWPGSTLDLNRTIDVHLCLLRRKLGDTGARPRYLHTIRGVGFRLWLDADAMRSSAESA